MHPRRRLCGCARSKGFAGVHQLGKLSTPILNVYSMSINRWCQKKQCSTTPEALLFTCSKWHPFFAMQYFTPACWQEHFPPFFSQVWLKLRKRNFQFLDVNLARHHQVHASQRSSALPSPFNHMLGGILQSKCVESSPIQLHFAAKSVDAVDASQKKNLKNDKQTL